MTRTTKLLLILAIALALTACGGCMKVGIDVAVAPDGSSSGRLLAGMDASFMQSGDSGRAPFAELSEASDNWKTREYREGNWLMTEAIGSAPAGKPLFPKDDSGDAPQTTVSTSARRLSTHYTLAMKLPPMADEMRQGAPEDADPQTQALVKSMLATFEIGFSLKGPGRVVATTGKVTAPGKAEWKLGFDAMSGGKPPDLSVTTELPNWTNLGRLADQLAYSGRLYDCAPALATALARGLLPNPPLNSASARKLDPEDYARLLEIIDKLDAAGRPAITESLMKKLGLNRDETSAEAIAKTHARLMKLDVRGLSDNAIGDALGQKLR